ncbi:hypothetical protein LTR70_010099 [Exophiala xenobiotica]|uniref:Nephrocystin 3-like N-terminal domain-containing protein n=1 Tax=Lithohypha guttulata TaxID=1690604 RepID=A0ABR0K7E4_9EURO|nr:hypothetical protein LTR24_006038 [Lithohypha guttulata]KAK5309663.1 hypothetical protein LTR70_010099 [Exophiala xenobiotica]
MYLMHTCQPGGSKRRRVPAINDTTGDDEGHGYQHQLHDYQLHEWAKNDQLNAFSDKPGQAEPQSTSERLCAMPANAYGSSTIGGNANVLMGNAQYNSGPGSHLYAPSTVAGNMNVHVSNAFYGHSHHSSQSATQEEPRTALKRALYYETMDNRKAQLDHVDSVSFDWIWTDTGFPRWLENDQGIFWISGKPASGKSTLVHHLVNSEVGSKRVKWHLARFHGSPMLLYFFFDFRAGTGTANTPVGMLRSLLLQLVEKSSAIEQYVLHRCGHRLGGLWPELENELMDLICDALRTQRLYICGFIDGLDEYKGGLRKLVATVLQLQERSHMKLCLASRPEPEISSKLQRASFSMQEHNAGTIKAYTNSALSELDEYLSQRELQSVARKIEQDANGVILWARFAVDEAVGAILQGWTLEDALTRLGTFPSELKEFYARTLHRLNSAQKLQAGVIFFILEHWYESYSACERSTRLEPNTLMLLCSRTLQTLDQTTNFCSDLNEGRFKLYVHVMLLGLVEFVPQYRNWTMPRLVHKSLQTFLHEDMVFTSIADRLSTTLDKRALGPIFYAQTLVVSAEVLVPDANDYWPNSNSRDLVAALDLLPRCRTSTLITFSAVSVQEALMSFGEEEVLDEPEHVEWLIRAAQTWLYREYLLSHSYSSFCCGASKQEPSSVRTRHPELFEFVRYGYFNAFNATMRSISDQLSERDRALLFAYVLSMPYLPDWDSRTEWGDYSEGYARRHHALWRMLPILLRSLCQGAHFLTLCIASAQMTVFDEVLTSIEDAGDVAKIRISPSIWWVHQEADIMLCWVGSPFHAHCRPTQQKRLSVLLSSGKKINSPVYEGGNVMDALFEAELWGSNTFLPRLDPFRYTHADQPHFSRVKFDVLIESGFDLSERTNCDRYLHSAERLLEFYYEKTGARGNMGNEGDEGVESDNDDELIDYASPIMDLKQHVIPYLKSVAHTPG